MLNRLLKLLGDDAEIDDALYQKIFDNMLERLKDKVAEIRAQAVTALQRLQVISEGLYFCLILPKSTSLFMTSLVQKSHLSYILTGSTRRLMSNCPCLHISFRL